MSSGPKVFKRVTESDFLPEGGGSGTSERLRAADPFLNQTIDGRYLITERLGEGGMGAVYVAEHLKLGKLVALKTIHGHFAGEATVSERFSREAMAAGRLEHPHIASAMDYGALEGGGAYLVMHLVRGPSVQDLLEKGALGWVRAASIGAQVADALAAAHDEGIIHRDLKPENVLLEDRDGSEHARILDFGVARIPEELARDEGGRRDLTLKGTVVGTPGYMAPEQALGERVNHRADLYALGILLYEMTTGYALFGEERLRDIVRRQMSMKETPRLAEVTGDAAIPKAFQHMVDRLLARRAEDRPASAREVRDGLTRIILETSGIIDKAALLERLSLLGRTPAYGVDGALLPEAEELEALGLGALAPAPSARAARWSSAPPPARRSSHPSPARSSAPGTESRPSAETLEPTPASPRGGLPNALLGALVALGIVGGVVALRDTPPPEPVAAPAGVDPTRVEEIVRETRAAAAAEERARQALRLDDDNREVRRAAARYFLDYPDPEAVDPVLRAISALEAARSCRAYASALDDIVELGDTRAVPAVERLSARPRRGCGQGRRTDCIACIRGELRSALAELRPEAPAEGDRTAP